MKRKWKWLAIGAAALGLAACRSSPPKPMDTVAHVDLKRYMGDWYVIANIPPFIEKGAHNSIENYALDADGTVATTFSYRAGSFDGKAKTLGSRAYVLDRQSNAIWGVQFIWPIKADYRIVYLDDAYTRVIVGREKRDYLWIMARTPQIPEDEYRRLKDIAATHGYDAKLIRKVPQQWN